MSANEESTIRWKNSSLLPVLPWLTAAIKACPKFSESFVASNGLERLLSNVDTQEQILFSSRASTKIEDLNMQRLMGIEVKIQRGGDIVGPRQHGLAGGQLTPALASRLFTVLCGYRLADVMSLLSGLYPTPTIVERSSLPTGSLPRYDSLSDWVKVLDNFRRISRKEHMSPVASSLSSSVHSGLDVQIDLLRRFARADTSRKWMKITSNFLSAAVHLAFLNSPGCKDEFPELPDTATAFLRMNSEKLGNSDQQFLQNFDSSVRGLGSLRNSLHFALGITPLYLLMPYDWSKATFNRRTLIEWGISLGNRKPQALLEIEKMIWRAVFAMAQGLEPPEQILLQFFNQVPWDSLESLSEPVRGWFDMSPIPQTEQQTQSLDQVASNWRLLSHYNPLSTNARNNSNSGRLYQEQPKDTIDHSGMGGSHLGQRNDSANVDMVDGGAPLPLEPAAGHAESPAALPTGYSLPNQDPVSSDIEMVDDCAGAPSVKSQSKPWADTHSKPQANTHSKPRTNTPRKRKRRAPPTFAEEDREDEEDLPTAGNGYDNPIDVNALVGMFPMKREGSYVKLEPKLSRVEEKKHSSEQSFSVYGASKDEHLSFTPIAHFQEDLKKMVDVMHAVVGQYSNGLPLHIADPTCSAFRILSQAEFDKLSDREVIDGLRKQHFLITGVSHLPLAFDEHGMRTLCHLKTVVELQDLSIPTRGHVDGGAQLTTGTAQDLIDESRKTNGKILNALEFPLEFSPLTPIPKFSSDLKCWSATRGFKSNNADTLYPTGHLRWGLGGLAGARTRWHIDSNGFLTFLKVMCGYKIWIVIYDERGDFTKICAFEDFVLDAVGNHHIEAILLQPGTIFVMRPNTTHMVFTPKPSICHGGHAYLTGLMQDTLRAMIHSFVDHLQITNTNHPPAGILLRRMALFYHAAFIFGGEDSMEDDEREHLPDVASVEGFVDFLTLCFLVIFSNVLDFRTYLCSNEDRRYSHLKDKYDLNNIDVQERVNMCSARGMCLDLLDWWNATFIIKAVENKEELSTFTEEFISKEARNILSYKSRASMRERKGAEGCTVEKLTSQVLNVIKIVAWREGWQWESIQVGSPADIDPSTMVMGFESCEFGKWVIEKREISLTFDPSMDLVARGCTASDRIFFEYISRSAVPVDRTRTKTTK